jgi:hypothetical protein
VFVEFVLSFSEAALDDNFRVIMFMTDITDDLGNGGGRGRR